VIVQGDLRQRADVGAVALDPVVGRMRVHPITIPAEAVADVRDFRGVSDRCGRR
jgi:hypothetical protein